MKKPLKAQSPAKLILSGEHAVVYGKPAIAMAINRYAESMISENLSPAILFNCLNFKYAKSFTLGTLKALTQRLQDKYHAFLEGRCGIREVLRTPFELLQFTVTNLLETLNISLSEGLEIRASSNIPIGCGMGSSAALVVSTLYALAHYFNLEIDPHRIIALGREAERLQHGFSSGIDLHLALTGGCLRFEEGRTSKRLIPKIPMALVQTGTPETSTGECVSYVANFFTKGSLAEEFAAITETFDQALSKNDITTLKECIKANHRLLVKIGVVPEKIQDFVRAVELEGGAAKICGAGSIAGDRAGAVLIVSERNLSHLTRPFGYGLQQIEGDLYGTRLI